MLRKRIDEAREQGFTLIELLIVIVVLGLLAGIVTLGVTKFSADAKTATCNATVDNLQIAADAYSAQNNGGIAADFNAIKPYVKSGAVAPAGFAIDSTTGKVSATC